MLRRLFFLFPDEPHAQRAVNQLMSLGISERRIHAMAQNVELKTLPQATRRQKNDTAFHVERFFWTFNLIVFVLALMGFIIALVSTEYNWAMFSVMIMAVTFIAGEQFAVHVPKVHLKEFSDALSHGEILLMIDVSSERVAYIEDLIHHNYPEAVIGGVSWTADAFGI